MTEPPHKPYATWTVDVFPDEIPEVTPTEVARQAYHRIMGSEMLPILTVHMPDGSTHDIDIDEVGP